MFILQLNFNYKRVYACMEILLLVSKNAWKTGKIFMRLELIVALSPQSILTFLKLLKRHTLDHNLTIGHCKSGGICAESGSVHFFANQLSFFSSFVLSFCPHSALRCDCKKKISS